MLIGQFTQAIPMGSLIGLMTVTPAAAQGLATFRPDSFDNIEVSFFICPTRLERNTYPAMRRIPPIKFGRPTE